MELAAPSGTAAASLVKNSWKADVQSLLAKSGVTLKIAGFSNPFAAYNMAKMELIV